MLPRRLLEIAVLATLPAGWARASLHGGLGLESNDGPHDGGDE